MTRRVMLSNLLCLLCFHLLVFPAFGDGNIFHWRNQQMDILQPQQKAVIEWDGKQEKLTIETKYEGPAAELAWLVPLPSKPIIKKASMALFEEMSQKTQEPFVVYTKLSDDRLLGIPEGPLAVRDKIGVYDVALLAPTDEKGVIQWLRDNEFAVDRTEATVISRYVSQKWWIVASRIHPDALTPLVKEQLAKGTIHPLEFTFDTKRCVYPMYMTSLAANTVEVLLWIKGPRHYQPETLADPGWDVEFFGGAAEPEFLDYDNVWGTKTRVRDDFAEYITKMRRVFRTASIKEDLYFGEADYHAFFDPRSPERVAMVATQLGIWKRTRGVPLLVDYLKKAQVVDEPHIQSTIWALGEIGSVKKLGGREEQLLAKFSRSDSLQLRMQCLLALNKSHSPQLAELVFDRISFLTNGDMADDRNNRAFDDELEKRLLVLWFDKNAPEKIQAKYRSILHGAIARLSEGIRAKTTQGASPGSADTLDKHGEWLLRRAAMSGDKELLAVLKDLHSTLKSCGLKASLHDDSMLSIAEAACGSKECIAKLADQVCSEGEAFIRHCSGRWRPNDEDLIAGTLRRTLCPRIDGEVSFAHALDVEDEPSFMCELAYQCLPDEARDEIGRAVLDKGNLGRYFELYMLGWLREPNQDSRNRLHAIWREAGKSDPVRNETALLALTIAKAWSSTTEIRWMLDHTDHIHLRNDALATLMELDSNDSWPLLEREVRATWDVQLRREHGYWDDMEMQENGLSDSLHYLSIQGFISRGVRSRDFASAYEKLCQDRSVYAGARYLLVSLLPYPYPRWIIPAVEGILDDAVAEGVDGKVFDGLVGLLGKLRDTERLIVEWERASESGRKDSIVKALLRTRDPLATPTLTKVLSKEWHDDFKACNGRYEAILDRFEPLDGQSGSEEIVDLLKRVLNDESFDVVYKACLLCILSHNAEDFHPEMTDVLKHDLPERLRTQLSRIMEFVDARLREQGNAKQNWWTC